MFPEPSRERTIDDRIFERPAHLINRCARMMARLGDLRFQPLGLAVAQMPVLAALRDGRSLPQKELARLVRIEQPTMAQLLARMERDGLIERKPDPEDGRSSLISLTPAARSKLPTAAMIMHASNDELTRGFTPDEIATLTALLRRVVDNLEDTLAQTSPRAHKPGR